MFAFIARYFEEKKRRRYAKEMADKVVGDDLISVVKNIEADPESWDMYIHYSEHKARRKNPYIEADTGSRGMTSGGQWISYGAGLTVQKDRRPLTGAECEMLARAVKSAMAVKEVNRLARMRDSAASLRKA